MSTKCSSRFFTLVHQCDESARLPEEDPLGAFGDDPAFNPSSSLFSPAAAIREAAFYNTTEGSSEVSLSTGYPQVFQHVPLPGLPNGYTVFFPVSSTAAVGAHFQSARQCRRGQPMLTPPLIVQEGADAHTMHRIWRYLRDAHYVTTRTETLRLRAAVYNAAHSTLVLWLFDISRLDSGSFHGRAAFRTVHADPFLASPEGDTAWARTLLAFPVVMDALVASLTLFLVVSLLSDYRTLRGNGPAGVQLPASVAQGPGPLGEGVSRTASDQSSGSNRHCAAPGSDPGERSSAYVESQMSLFAQLTLPDMNEPSSRVAERPNSVLQKQCQILDNVAFSYASRSSPGALQGSGQHGFVHAWQQRASKCSSAEGSGRSSSLTVPSGGPSRCMLHYFTCLNLRVQWGSSLVRHVTSLSVLICLACMSKHGKRMRSHELHRTSCCRGTGRLHS